MPPEQRPTVFYRGYDVFDQVKVGLRLERSRPTADQIVHALRHDACRATATAGTSYGTTLSDEDKRAIVEYMKTF